MPKTKRKEDHPVPIVLPDPISTSPPTYVTEGENGWKKPQGNLAEYAPAFVKVVVDHPSTLYLRLAAAEGSAGDVTFDVATGMGGNAIHLSLYKTVDGKKVVRSETVVVYLREWIAQAIATFEADLARPEMWERP